MSAIPFARPDRVAGPISAAPAPLRALLSRALVALLDPLDPTDPGPGRTGPGCRAPGYAAFDAPTYQRRGLRIAGLEDDAPAAAAAGRAIATRASSSACSTDRPSRSTT
jgi:hypothetical protein